jgi:type II secretory pathway pseudopilin PulG
MSTLAIVVIAVVVVLTLLLAGGIVAARRRTRQDAPEFERRLAEADRALQVALADDRGWDPTLLRRAADEALARSHPGVEFDPVHLVWVEDRPGVEQDRAHYDAHTGSGRVRVVLTRDRGGWHGETEA